MQKNKKNKYKTVVRNALVIGAAIGASVLLANAAFAAGDGAGTTKFNIDAAVTAAADPGIAALDAHWPKGAIITGGASAILGEGDARQRAVRAVIGAIVCGGSMKLLFAALT